MGSWSSKSSLNFVRRLIETKSPNSQLVLNRQGSSRSRVNERRRLSVQALECRRVLAANLMITEFLASNAGGLDDSDGESSDWIEIYNPTLSAVDLSGWSLTDDANDLDQWTFPATTIQPSEFIVVFASGKDRTVAGQELHTNFKLSSDGEYLALVDAAGVVVHEYAPTYPEQFSNVSYGTPFQIDTLLQEGDSAKTLVPTDNGLGDSWKLPTFDDAAWSSTPLGVGFGIVEPGFDVRYVKAQPSGAFGGTIDSLTIAEQVLATPDYQASSVVERASEINYLSTGSAGRFGNDSPFPTQTIGDDHNQFVIEVTTTVNIPTAGEWTFGVNSDDGFGLSLSRGVDTWSMSFQGLRGANDTLQTFSLPESGEYDLRLVAFERSGGASAELFAAPGIHSSFSTAFDLVGDVSNGGLEVYEPYVAGNSPWVNSDVRTLMHGINSSAFIRAPFQVASASELESLSLDVQYDDGFVAFINGVEVARRNSPISVSYDATATLNRSAEEALLTEQIALDETALTAIVDGTNVLAIHGLNSNVQDDSFLVRPRLVSTSVLTDSPSFFATPTPNAINQDAISGVLRRVEIDTPGGFYETSQTVSISAPDAFAQVIYTTDGSEPTSENGILYSGPITINQTTVLRATAVATDYVSQPSVTRTYLFLDDVLNQSPTGDPPVGWPATWNTNSVDYGMDPDVIALEGATRVKEALLSIPTMSIATDLDHLFSPSSGIYSNAQQDGRDWERPASAEWLNPDGSDGFQVNAGLRIRGGYSRGDFNPKHALKLFFRGSYGDSTLNYPVHGDEGVSEFKKLDLRTAQNYSWSSSGNASNNFVAEVLARYNQRDMGQPYTRSTWFHLYLNGQYWGLYQTQERADANFAASYFGGNASDYDVLKPERGDYRNIATDGNFDAYTELWEQANARAPDGVTPAFVDHANYMRAQGKNPDGTDNASFPVLLDVDNLIVYMIETLRGGNLDAPISNFLGNDQPNNYFAIRDRTGREGFRFFQHDAEHTMRNVNENRNGPWNATNYEIGVDFFNPQWLHQQLMANEEYRVRFADTVQRVFFNDGPLTPTALTNRLNEEVAKIEAAVIAESARWGDAKRGANSPLGQSDFLNAVSNLINSYIPNRQQILIDQFRNTTLGLADGNGGYTVSVPAPLFPTLDAPGYLINDLPQPSGQVAEGSELRFQASEGLVIYTTDGTDPRLVGGGINPNAVLYDPQTTTQDLITSGDLWRYLDTGVQPANSWSMEGFDDATWAEGASELGYGDGDEATVVSFGGDAGNKHITTYFRKNVNADLSSGVAVGLNLRVKRDDGIAVYLNGIEVFRDNLPAGPLDSTTLANTFIGGAGESTWLDISLDPALLQHGENVIAAELHQNSGTSSDITFDLELSLATQTASPVIIDQTTTVKSRLLANGTQWSALNEGLFQVLNAPADSSNLRVTEIGYNPMIDGDAEYLELTNVSSGVSAVTIDLDGVRITEGPSATFSFPVGISLLPGESVVVVHDTLTFQAAYPSVAAEKIAGEYTGKLSNSGERIVVIDSTGTPIADLNYGTSDPWPEWADGEGGSLVLINPANVPVSETGKPYHYRGSVQPGGSPAAPNQARVGIEVSEILAHTDPPLRDSIELYNPTTQAVDLGGWYISDDPDTPHKYRFPTGTSIDGGGYLVVDEDDFNPALPNADALIPFALSSSQGETVWLFSGNGVQATGLQDEAPFSATFNGVSVGLLEGSAGRLVPLANRSLGTLNGAFEVSPLVISEIHYHPLAPSSETLLVDPTLQSDDLEFIEIQNASGITIDLTDWRLRGEADFDFAPGSSLAAGEVVVLVSFDPSDPLNNSRLAAFQAEYSIDAGVRIEGPFTGKLSNSHGLVKLQAPDDPPVDNPTFIPRVTVDEVLYDDLAPWPTMADGTGESLQRVWPSTLGNYYDSWADETPTPGYLPDRPQVEAIVINQGDLSRSSVNRLTVTFDSIVDIEPNAFVIHERDSGNEVENVVLDIQTAGGKSIVDITFAPGAQVVDRGNAGHSLSDGTYQLTILRDRVRSAGTDTQMAFDHEFGEAATDRFFRLFGDSDGDRDVDGQDYGRFGASFLQTSQDPNFDPEYDSDGDGDVDGQDYGRFGQNFLGQMPH